jgi:hypothetical protein
MADSLIALLGDPQARRVMGRRAYEYTRNMTWTEVGATYAEIFAEVARRPVAALVPSLVSSRVPSHVPSHLAGARV